jgi:hypothetical protein
VVGAENPLLHTIRIEVIPNKKMLLNRPDSISVAHRPDSNPPPSDRPTKSGQWDAWRGPGSVGGFEFSAWVGLGDEV